MRLLVAGSSGQLAHALGRAELPGADWSVLTLGRPRLDLADPASIRKAVAEFTPDIVINAAAYTAVDKAESAAETAFAINASGAGQLAEAAAERGVPILHLSTDYVFSGKGDRPYVEDDATGPLNVYGRSKLAGEKAVAAANDRHLVLRTSWVHGEHGGNFLKTMLRLGAEKDELRVVDDQYGSPTYARDLAEAIVRVCATLGKREPWGVYHLTNAGATSWFEFAGEIFRSASRHGYDAPELKAIATSDYPTPAERPRYAVLDNSRFRAQFGFAMRDWRKATQECVDRLLRM
ncbi:MAG: dTDP-4-dehydrorhamnose reductase [Pseudomonadota bacterium]|nr:dTDP-4-dehydrorhamnose reductase [Pseudomonadota bacterium]